MTQDEVARENSRLRQKQVDEKFKGKTIKSIDASSVNTWSFFFTDGSMTQLWAEDAVYTPYGNIPGIQIHDNDAIVQKEKA